MFGSLGAVLIVGLILVFANTLFGDDRDPLVVAAFCESNPESIVCTVDYPTYTEVATEMFDMLLEDYEAGYSDGFCNSYMEGKLQGYCLSENIEIMPVNTLSLSTTYTVEEVSVGIVDIYTVDEATSNPLWVFRLGINKTDGVFHLTGLTYLDTPKVNVLPDTEIEVFIFMQNMITDSDEGYLDFCETYFTGDALAACEIDYLTVTPVADAIFLYQVQDDILENGYIYTAVTADGLNTYEYSVVFEEVLEVPLISSVTIIEVIE